MNRSSTLFRRLVGVLFIGAMALAACAPADLDITPTVTPTPTATVTPTPEFTPTPVLVESAGVGDSTEAVVDMLVENVPQTIPAGAVQWRLDFTQEPETVRNVNNGIAKRVSLTEAQGGRASLTFGVFDTPEDANTYYEFVRNLRTVLENGQPDDNFPQPNLFGQGLYGSNAIFQLDDVFVEVSVEAFSSTAGNPLPPLSRQVLDFVESTLASAGDAAAASDTASAEPTAEPESPDVAEAGAGALDSILASMPDVLPAGAVQWRYDRSAEPQQLGDVSNGEARRVRINDPGGATGSLTFGVFDSAEDAQTYYEFIRDLRTVLENGQPNDNFPQPNLFGQGLYGSNAIFQLDNVFLEVSVEQFPSTAGNPLPGLSREALAVIEVGLAETGGEPAAGGNDSGDVSGDALTLEAIVEALPETINAGGSAWERGTDSADNVQDGSAVMVGYSGETSASVYIGLFESQADAEAYAPAASGSRSVLPVGEQFIVVVVDAGDAPAALPGLMSAVLAAVDSASGA